MRIGALSITDFVFYAGTRLTNVALEPVNVNPQYGVDNTMRRISGRFYTGTLI